MTSEERAARLQLVKDDEIERIVREERKLAKARRIGSWRWTLVGEELQLRSQVLPTMPLDLTRTEAADLMHALGMALNEPPPLAPRRSWLARLRDWLARRTWNRKHEIERSYALKQMADEFKERGGW